MADATRAGAAEAQQPTAPLPPEAATMRNLNFRLMAFTGKKKFQSNCRHDCLAIFVASRLGWWAVVVVVGERHGLKI